MFSDVVSAFRRTNEADHVVSAFRRTKWSPRMPKLIVLYPPPADVTLFERRYRQEHAPMVLEKIPGLKKFVAAHVLGTPTGSAAPYQRVAELYFDSLEALKAALASGGGQAAVAHAIRRGYI